MKGISRLFSKQVYDGARYIKEYYEYYGESKIKFYVPSNNIFSFSQIEKDAVELVRPVVMYLHSRIHDETELFCRNIINSQYFSEFINQNDCLLYLVDMSEAEGLECSIRFQSSAFPFIAVLIPEKGRLEMVLSINGVAEMEIVRQYLDGSMVDARNKIRSEKEKKHAIEQRRSVQLEQDAAYERSLKADQEKLRMIENERKLEIEENEKRLEMEKQNEIENKLCQEKIIALKEKFKDEPSDEPENVCNYTFRFPDGSQIRRRFLKTTTISDLYEFVSSTDKMNRDEFAITEMISPRKTIMPELLANEVFEDKSCLIVQKISKSNNS